ncbi:AMP-binding protein [Alsobacter sp. KACC 23698]|uniref:AMP-binding protein n=1 Tax=Alsobacter sp. KACC 23698 TaxID=3149229 RepID=A0AAU7JF23_9HYPH
MDGTTERSQAEQGRPVASQSAMAVAGALYAQLHGGRPPPPHLTPASSLDREWGFDSLSRAELLLRLERNFKVRLPETLLASAETLDALAAAAVSAGGRPTARAPAPVLSPGEVAAPVGAETLTAVLDWHAQRCPDRVHVVLHGGDGSEIQIRYGELRRRALAAAGGLQRAGLSPGERVALMLPTGADFIVAFFGVLYAGGAPMPLYPPSRPSQLLEHLQRQAEILRNATAAILIVPAEGRAVAAMLRLQVESLKLVATVHDLGDEPPDRAGRNAPHALALVQYTSGSTGRPKGVALSHANLLANIRAMGAAMEASSRDVFVSWLPLYHDMGLIGAWLGSLYFGAPVVIMAPLVFLVRPAEWLWTIQRHRATLTAAPNFAYELCIRKIADADLDGLDLSCLRMAANGAEAVSADTVRRFTERFARCGFRPSAMAPVYGLAENAVGLAFPPPGRAPVFDRIDRSALAREGRARPAPADASDAVEFVGCGRPLPGHEVRILDEAGETPDRREGRLQFRGPSATAGYVNDPAKTRDLFDGTWLNTGDLAYTVSGELFITGRSKDIIIRAGRHIYPEEIESAVGELDGVRRGCVAVFSAPDVKAGTEKIVVMAEARDFAPERLADLRARVTEAAGRLLDAPPEEVVLVPPHVVPKTSSGKLRRSAARDLYLAGRLAPSGLPPWLQGVRFALQSLSAAAARAGRTAGAYVFAARWWGAIVIGAAVGWPLVVAIPGRERRWRVLSALARTVLWAAGTPVALRGAERIVRDGVIAATHASYVDGLALAAVLPGPLTFVAKRELAGQWVAGPFLRALGTVFVARDSSDLAAADLGRTAAAARSGGLLVVFPEGTFTREPGLRPFRLGAFLVAAETGRPVTPVVLRGTRSVLRGDQWFPRKATIVVEALAPEAAEGTGFEAAVRLRDAVRRKMLPAFGEPDLAP